MPDLTRYTESSPTRIPARRTSRAISQLEHQTLVRLATVQAEGMVQAEKLREVDNLAREAMNGQAFLSRWRDVLAAGDPLLADELSFYADLARAGKGEIIAEAIASFCQGSR